MLKRQEWWNWEKWVEICVAGYLSQFTMTTVSFFANWKTSLETLPMKYLLFPEIPFFPMKIVIASDPSTAINMLWLSHGKYRQLGILPPAQS